MGLSNEERFENVVWSIKRLTDLLPKIDDHTGIDDNHKQLASLIRKLWSALYSNTNNSSFWLFGSSMKKSTLDASSPFQVAMLSHGSDIQQSVKDLLDKKNDRVCDPKRKEDIDYGTEHMPELSEIIRHGRHAEYNYAVVMVHLEMEQLQYSINRYSDKFSDSMKAVRDIVADIHGVLFSIMAGDTIFFEAYLLHNIFDKLLSGPWDSKENLPFALAREFHLHHKMHVRDRGDLELAKLLVLWKDIQFKEKIPVDIRVGYLLNLAGSDFGAYPHEAKKLYNKIRSWNRKAEEADRVSITLVKSIVEDRLAVLYKEKKEQETEQFKRNREYCQLTHHMDIDLSKVLEAEEFHVNKYK